MGKKRVAKAKKSPPALSPRMTALSKLTPYRKNPRIIPDKAVKAVAASLKRFGWKQAIVADPKGVIVAGETRYKAAVSLGWTSAPVVTIPASQARAFRVIDNRTSEMTSWDTDPLPDALAGLDDLDIFSFDDVLQLASTAGKTDPDDIPETPKNPVSQRGDLWVLGDHRLLCGDATNASDVARLMGTSKASLFATDPPYMVGYTGADRPHKSKDWSSTYKDVPVKDAEAFIRSLCTNAIAVCRDNAGWYIWHAHPHASMISAVWTELTILTHQVVLWVKNREMPSHCMYWYQHEPCFVGWKKGHKPKTYGVHRSTVWAASFNDGDKRQGNHPTQKPVELFMIPMRLNTKPGDVCYEPFAGSGSQIIAGEMERRKVFALEIEPVFVDVTVKRWEDFTGQKAQRKR